MEKKRRARINDSLETLKQILLESKSANFREAKSGQRTAKLEKADILEMTVRYLQQLHGKLPESKKEPVAIMPADSSCDRNVKIGLTLLPTRLESGHVVYIFPNKMPVARSGEMCNDRVWRPW